VVNLKQNGSNAEAPHFGLCTHSQRQNRQSTRALDE